MSKHLAKDSFYSLPSGTQVHPCRLIFKDGTLMWKHALLADNVMTSLPKDQAHEAHIVKTAQRLEELNAWVSQDLEPWEFLKPTLWYHPEQPDLSQGIAVYFKHTTIPTDLVMTALNPHIQDHETLRRKGNYIYFARC